VDGERAGEACELGARFAHASEAELAAMREAFEPVHTELKEDPLTSQLIAQITEMKESVTTTPFAIPDDCIGEAPTVATPASDALLPGRYTTGEVTFDEFVATLVDTGLAQAEAEEFVRIDLDASGSITIVITANGGWQEIYSWDGEPEHLGWSAHYQTADEETLILSEPGDDCAVTVRFAAEDDQLHLEMVDAQCPDDPETELDIRLLSTWLYQTVPLTRIE
jgi:hypothetical protein